MTTEWEKVAPVAAVLGEWSGTSLRPLDQADRQDEIEIYSAAFGIVQEDQSQIERPDKWAKDMAKAADHAIHLRAILQSLDHMQARLFSMAMQLSGLYPDPSRRPIPKTTTTRPAVGVWTSRSIRRGARRSHRALGPGRGRQVPGRHWG